MKESDCLIASESASIIGMESSMNDLMRISKVRFIYTVSSTETDLFNDGCLTPLQAPQAYLDVFAAANDRFLIGLIFYILLMGIIGAYCQRKSAKAQPREIGAVQLSSKPSIFGNKKTISLKKKENESPRPVELISDEEHSARSRKLSDDLEDNKFNHAKLRVQRSTEDGKIES